MLGSQPGTAGLPSLSVLKGRERPLRSLAFGPSCCHNGSLLVSKALLDRWGNISPLPHLTHGCRVRLTVSQAAVASATLWEVSWRGDERVLCPVLHSSVRGRGSRVLSAMPMSTLGWGTQAWNLPQFTCLNQALSHWVWRRVGSGREQNVSRSIPQQPLLSHQHPPTPSFLPNEMEK